MRIRDWSFRRVLFRSNRAMIEGKRVVLVDDSIVRGTTSLKIVQMIRDAGAREVHIRVASPMIYYPDFYGIDTPDAEKLLANQYDGLQAMCEYIRADSLAFLSIDGLYRAVGGEPRNPRSEEHTSELQSLMRISYAVFCLKKKK